MKDKRMMRGLLSDMYESDAWVRAFMDECFIMWGLPCSTMACMSQKDRTLFAWGMLHITQSMSKDRDIWMGMKEKVLPSKAAWEYSRRFWTTTGMDLIPPMPGPEAQEPQTIALAGPMKVDGKDTHVSGSS
jgi:hypothetical protein